MFSGHTLAGISVRLVASGQQSNKNEFNKFIIYNYKVNESVTITIDAPVESLKSKSTS